MPARKAISDRINTNEPWKKKTKSASAVQANYTKDSSKVHLQNAASRQAKRKHDEIRSDLDEKHVRAVKQKTSHVKPPSKLTRNKIISAPIINHPPTQKLKVYVCGDISAGELGLGPRIKKAKQPALNPNLKDVVQVAVGGMHELALTSDNRILFWGVNDMGAVGRETAWKGGMVDANAAGSDDDDGQMNPLESTPAAISRDHFPQGVVFTQLAAGDSCSFALTAEGIVYGWGTFRDDQGNQTFAFDARNNLIQQQRTPLLLPSLRVIIQIACGADHVLALDQSGSIYIWGNGQQYQLGRRILERSRLRSVIPYKISIPRRKIVYVGCGSYLSFAIDQDGDVWAWGLNSFGETGCPVSEDDEGTHHVTVPSRVDSLRGRKLKCVSGGAHHSVGVTADGECLVWGRADMGQCGVELKELPDDHVIKDFRGNIRIVSVPTAVPGCDGRHRKRPYCGHQHRWKHQTGHGPEGKPKDFTEDDNDDDPEDVMIAKQLEVQALRNVRANWAGAGGQFSVITALADD